MSMMRSQTQSPRGRSVQAEGTPIEGRQVGTSLAAGGTEGSQEHSKGWRPGLGTGPRRVLRGVQQGLGFCWGAVGGMEQSLVVLLVNSCPQAPHSLTASSLPASLANTSGTRHTVHERPKQMPPLTSTSKPQILISRHMMAGVPTNTGLCLQLRTDKTWHCPLLGPSRPASRAEGGGVFLGALPSELRVPAVQGQEGKGAASASGRAMLWMAHCRMPSKVCCGTEQL